MEKFLILYHWVNRLEAFQIYKSIKLHFNVQRYDIRKYGLNSEKFTSDELNKRNDKYYFDKFIKKYNTKEFINLVSSNMIYDTFHNITYFDNYDSIVNYKRARKVSGNLSFYMAEDFQTILDDMSFRDLFNQTDQIPHVFEMLLNQKIHPETLVFLNREYKLLEKIKNNDLLTKMISKRIEKYHPFVSFRDIDEINMIRNNLKQLVMERQN